MSVILFYILILMGINNEGDNLEVNDEGDLLEF